MMGTVVPLAGGHPPAFVAAARAEFDALRQACPDLGYIDAVMADICGALRGKRLPVGEAEKLFECGMQIPRSVYLMDAHGEMANPFGRGYGDGDPDGVAWPIPGTVTPVWQQDPERSARRARMLMTLRDDTGQADPAEPRAALERVLERFADLRLTPVTAFELEFYLIDPVRDARGHPQPPVNPVSGARERSASVYGIEDLDRYQAFLSAFARAADTECIPVSATSKEYAPGQFEVNVKHQPNACAAADHVIVLKQLVKAVARAEGLDATFMAKPYANAIGSGLHVHLSLLDESGHNVFDDGTPQGSSSLRHAIGGLQALMLQSMALFAPNHNSYRRFQPDMFAPVNRRWGFNNRSVGLRVPLGPGESRRVEHRVAGTDANPYFVLAAVLAGVHHGMVSKRDPGPTATANVSHEPDAELPTTLEAALSHLPSDTLASYFGEETLSLYCETKRIEARRFAQVITAAEYDWYL